MIYLKAKKEDFGNLIKTTNKNIKIGIYEDMFYSTCPKCGKERRLDWEELILIIESGGDFSGTSIHCSSCSKDLQR